MSGITKGHIGKSNIASLNANKEIKLSVLDLETGIKTEYNSTREAARALTCQNRSIIKNMNSIKQKPYKGRYVFTKL